MAHSNPWRARGAAGHVTIGSLPVATPQPVPLSLSGLLLAAPRITTTVLEDHANVMFRKLQTLHWADVLAYPRILPPAGVRTRAVLAACAGNSSTTPG